MYQNTAAKGMGPWGWQYYTSNANQKLPRYFDADPVEALVGRYEFEDGSRGGNARTRMNIRALVERVMPVTRPI